MFSVHKSFINIVIIVALFLITPVWSQIGYYFGQNKVIYKNFEWSVFRSEHFDVHYYPEEEEAARNAARMAERGYDYLSEVLNHKINERIPLILYASLNDFQQTNVIHGIIGQGTRGVTEGLKNRVVLPITGSYREFNHVLVHELVHAFQFDLMLRGGFKNRQFNPPLWFVEGMAEYLSIGMDNTTRMWVRDGLMHDKLMTVNQLNGAYDIRVYRLGESLWHYIGETYGKNTVGKVFKSGIFLGSVDLAIKKVLGVETEELTKAWHDFSRRLVMPEVSTMQKPEQIAELVTHRQGYYHRMNLIPAVSPDGSQIAYVANKNLHDEIYLLRKDHNGQITEQRLVKGGKSRQFEALRYFQTSIGWSRDGRQIAFISKSGRDDALYVMNPQTKKLSYKFIFDELNGLQSPTFSPDGRQISFVGITGGVSNLYVINLGDKKLKKLTDEPYTVMHPQWSPDGESIVFVTDRGSGTDLSELLFGDYDLALYHFDSGKIELITELDGSATNPQWSPDGREIAFISDYQGIPNIYRVHLTNKQITRITNLQNGVSGITEVTPAFSWSADGRYMVFSVFKKASWHLYRMEVENSQENLQPMLVQNENPATSLTSVLAVPETDNANPENSVIPANRPSEAWLPDISDPNTIYENYSLEDSSAIVKRNYSNKFKLDAISVGGGYDTFYGSVGQALFYFSDLLGHHNLYISSELQFNSLLHSNFGVSYLNQGSRINYGMQAFQINYSYALYGSFNTLGLLRNTYRGVNGIAAYPFSRFSRIEVFGGVTWVDQDVVEETYTPGRINRQSRDINLFNYYQVGTALVYDNTLYGMLGPINGRRSRFSVETTVNDFQFTNLMGDYRRYFNIGHRSVLALRLLGGTSLGRDKQFFSIGGPYTFRGADFDTFYGTNFVISNLEYRFPLVPFAPPAVDFLSTALFFDVAGAWGIDAPGYSTETFQPFSTENGFHFQDLHGAVGASFRLNLGYFLLQYDFAWPTDLQNFGKVVKKFSINTFF